MGRSVQKRSVALYDAPRNRLYFVPVARIIAMYIDDLKFTRAGEETSIVFTLHTIVHGLDGIQSPVEVKVASPDPLDETFLEYAKALFFDEVKSFLDLLLYEPLDYEPRSESFTSLVKNRITVSEQMRLLLDRYSACITGQKEYVTLL